MASQLQDMYIKLTFSPKKAMLLIRKQRQDSLERLRVLTDKNGDDIFNVMRKPGGQNAGRMPDRGQQVSVIAQENMKQAAFLFHHRLRCTLNWKVMGVCEDAVHLLAEQKKLKDEYKASHMLPKIKKSDMAETM